MDGPSSAAGDAEQAADRSAGAVTLPMRLPGGRAREASRAVPRVPRADDGRFAGGGYPGASGYGAVPGYGPAAEYGPRAEAGGYGPAAGYGPATETAGYGPSAEYAAGTGYARPAAPAPGDDYRAAGSGAATAAQDGTTVAGHPAEDHPAADGYAANDNAAGARARELPEADARSGHRAAPRESRLAQLPYLVVLVCAACGFFLAWHGTRDVAGGVETVGGALLAAALARLVLPRRAAGLLASRGRFADVLGFAVLGAGLLAIGLALPPS